jgi:hypothetical protein
MKLILNLITMITQIYTPLEQLAADRRCGTRRQRSLSVSGLECEEQRSGGGGVEAWRYGNRARLEYLMEIY